MAFVVVICLFAILIQYYIDYQKLLSYKDGLTSSVKVMLTYIKEDNISSIENEIDVLTNTSANIHDVFDIVEPSLMNYAKELGNIDFNTLDITSFNKLKSLVLECVEMYNDRRELFDFVRAFIGDGEDKLYLFAAQNSAEIRAGGGFPGSIGTVSVTDGILRIGDFEPVNNVSWCI